MNMCAECGIYSFFDQNNAMEMRKCVCVCMCACVCACARQAIETVIIVHSLTATRQTERRTDRQLDRRADVAEQIW